MRRGIKLDALVKHLSVFGLPGSGKTTSIYHQLMQLCSRGIPFLVLETGKSEYRLLKCLKHHKDRRIRQLAKALRVYTPGSSVSPMRHNPLAERPGVSRDQHIENLLACFKAAMPMSGPLPALLGEALEQVYERHVDNQPPPRMAGVVAAMKRTLSSKGYSRDVDSDIRAAWKCGLAC